MLCKPVSPLVWMMDLSAGVETTRHFLLEWLSYTHRYIPVELLEVIPQRLNWRPPYYHGRNDLETIMASESAADWVTKRILEPSQSTWWSVWMWCTRCRGALFADLVTAWPCRFVLQRCFWVLFPKALSSHPSTSQTHMTRPTTVRVRWPPDA